MANYASKFAAALTATAALALGSADALAEKTKHPSKPPTTPTTPVSSSSEAEANAAAAAAAAARSHSTGGSVEFEQNIGGPTVHVGGPKLNVPVTVTPETEVDVTNNIHTPVSVNPTTNVETGDTIVNPTTNVTTGATTQTNSQDVSNELDNSSTNTANSSGNEVRYEDNSTQTFEAPDIPVNSAFAPNMGTQIASGPCGETSAWSAGLTASFISLSGGKQRTEVEGVPYNPESKIESIQEYMRLDLISEDEKKSEKVRDDASKRLKLATEHFDEGDHAIHNCLINRENAVEDAQQHQFDLADQAHAHNIAYTTHLHNLNRTSNKPGERKGASVEEHVTAHLYTAETNPQYGDALKCAYIASAKVANDTDSAKPKDVMMAMLGIDAETGTVEETQAVEGCEIGEVSDNNPAPAPAPVQ